MVVPEMESLVEQINYQLDLFWRRWASIESVHIYSRDYLKIYTECPGCRANIVRYFHSGFEQFYDCNLFPIQDHEGVICQTCLRLASLSDASIVQQLIDFHKDYRIHDYSILKDIIKADLLKTHKLRAYLEALNHYL